MTAKEFILEDIESRFGVGVEVHNQHYTGAQWLEKMELYHQAKLKLLSEAVVVEGGKESCVHEWGRPVINADNYRCRKCGVWKEHLNLGK